MKPVIVISAVNFTDGGPLAIMRQCAEALEQGAWWRTHRIVFLVHDASLLADYEHIEAIAYPRAKRSYAWRLWYEYFAFRRLSARLRPQLWLSLHDISPRVHAQRQTVYVHNCSFANRLKASDLRFDLTYPLFTLFYKHLLRINARANAYCVVQQPWLRPQLSSIMGVDQSRVVVAPPVVEGGEAPVAALPQGGCRRFFYPSYPRPFKNFETVCRAVSLLHERGVRDFTVAITIDLSQSAYARWVVDKFGDLPQLRFTGVLDAEGMRRAYDEADCLVFASRLESWGLPISEFKPTGKPMILADLPYAHCTAQGAAAVAYFGVTDAEALAERMLAVIRADYSQFRPQPRLATPAPYAPTWHSLFELLTKY